MEGSAGLSRREVSCQEHASERHRAGRWGEGSMEQGEQMPWLLDSRHVEMECLKEIVKSLSYTKEKLLEIIINPGNYDEETVQRAWDHLNMIDEGLLARKDGLLSAEIHRSLIEIKKKLKKMKRQCDKRERPLSQDRGDGE
jgi:hypothetical protein